MCESSVYIRKSNEDGKDELLMEDVAYIKPLQNGGFLVRGLLGESREVSGTLFEIDLMSHRVIFTQTD